LKNLNPREAFTWLNVNGGYKSSSLNNHTLKVEVYGAIN